MAPLLIERAYALEELTKGGWYRVSLPLDGTQVYRIKKKVKSFTWGLKP